MARLTPGSRFAAVKDPYESKARKKERAAEAAHTRRLKWYLGGGGLALLAIAAGLYLTVFSGTKAGESPLSAEELDVANMKFLDKRLTEVNSLIADAAISPSEKPMYLKEKKDLEKQREDLLKKRPDLK